MNLVIIEVYLSRSVHLYKDHQWLSQVCELFWSKKVALRYERFDCTCTCHSLLYPVDGFVSNSELIVCIYRCMKSDVESHLTQNGTG